MTKTKEEILIRASEAAEVLEMWDPRVLEAQQDMEFDEGIKVVVQVVAEFVASLAHLFDQHGQDFGEILNNAAEIYMREKMETADGRAAVAEQLMGEGIDLDDLAKALGLDLSEAVES